MGSTSQSSGWFLASVRWSGAGVLDAGECDSLFCSAFATSTQTGVIACNSSLSFQYSPASPQMASWALSSVLMLPPGQVDAVLRACFTVRQHLTCAARVLESGLWMRLLLLQLSLLTVLSLASQLPR